MKKNKSNLDERQELKLLKIEHNGCCLAFWGLLIVMLVQQILGNMDAKRVAGEWIVFMSLCVYLVSACIKNGIWDRRLKPTFKTNTVASLIAGVVTGAFWFIISYRNYHKLAGSIATGSIMFLCVGGLCFTALTVFSGVYKKRVKKLEEEVEESEEEIEK